MSYRLTSLLWLLLLSLALGAEAIAQVVRTVTPSAVELPRGLSDQQIPEMGQAFAKDQREHRAQYVAPPVEEQIRDRAEQATRSLLVELRRSAPWRPLDRRWSGPARRPARRVPARGGRCRECCCRAGSTAQSHAV